MQLCWYLPLPLLVVELLFSFQLMLSPNHFHLPYQKQISFKLICQLLCNKKQDLACHMNKLSCLPGIEAEAKISVAIKMALVSGHNLSCHANKPKSPDQGTAPFAIRSFLLLNSSRSVGLNYTIRIRPSNE